MAGSMPARRIASRMATPPSRGAGVVDRPPMNRPMAVRQALTMTASCLLIHFLLHSFILYWQKLEIVHYPLARD